MTQNDSHFQAPSPQMTQNDSLFQASMPQMSQNDSHFEVFSFEMTQNDSFSGLKCPTEHTLSVAGEPPATPPAPQNDTPEGNPSVAGDTSSKGPLRYRGAAGMDPGSPTGRGATVPPALRCAHARLGRNGPFSLACQQAALSLPLRERRIAAHPPRDPVQSPGDARQSVM